MNKIIAVVLMTIMVLTGCHSNNEFDELHEKEKIEIEFWYGLTGVLGDAMELYIERFNESQDSITVKGVTQESYEITAKALQAAIVKRDTPAVVLLEDNQMHKIGNKGGLMPLNDLIESRADFDVDDFIPYFIAQGQFNSNTYALPLYATTQVLYYREDMFREKGVDPSLLSTWEGVAEAARRLTVRNDQDVLVYGFEPIQGREDLINAAINRGGQFVSEDGTTILIAEAPWVQSWEQFRIWLNEEEIMRVHYGGEGWEYWYATIDDVLQGRAAAYMGSTGDHGDLDFNIISAHVRPYWTGYESNPTGVVNAHAICIPAQTSEIEAEAAFEFIKFMTSTDISADWSMETGYLPVRKSSLNTEAYLEYLKIHPEYNVTKDQIISSRQIFDDPTGGKIYDALKVAAEKVQIQNISAAVALEEARRVCQEALDEILKESGRP